MSTAHLLRIAYASATPAELSRAELDAQLSSWRRLNARRGITGFLVYDRASVFQVLEGFPEIVEELYAHIARDPRHDHVTQLAAEARTHRSFGDWSLGLARATLTDLGTLPGLSALSDPAFRFWHGDAAMAGVLLQAFTAWPWRRMIA